MTDRRCPICAAPLPRHYPPCVPTRVWDYPEMRSDILQLFVEAARAGHRRYRLKADSGWRFFRVELSSRAPTPASETARQHIDRYGVLRPHVLIKRWDRRHGTRFVLSPVAGRPKPIASVATEAADPCPVCGAPREYREGMTRAIHLGNCGDPTKRKAA